jgi:hypothetical protein
MTFLEIDWSKYNKPPFLPQWLCTDETLEMARYDDGLNADIDKNVRGMVEQYDLDNMKGNMLDRLGKLLDTKRNGDNDDHYRIRLKVKILLNKSTGSINDIIKIAELLYSGEDVHIVPNYPAGIRILHDGEGTPGLDFNQIMRSTLAAGVSYDTTELFNFIENEILSELKKITIHRNPVDLFPEGPRYNGRLLADQGTILRADGSMVYDGTRNAIGTIPIIGTIFDYYFKELFADGSHIANGDEIYSGFQKVYEDEYLEKPVLPKPLMSDVLSLSIGIQPITDSEDMNEGEDTLRVVRPMRCDGSKTPSCSVYDGTVVCDGSHNAYDGYFYSGDVLISEEAF